MTAAAPPPLQAAMVLAAGRGTRMGGGIPKPLRRLAGRALVDHVLDRLAQDGVARAVVNVHHRAAEVEAHLAARTPPPQIQLSDERALLRDTGGALCAARPLLGNAPFWVCNCDAIWTESGRSNLERLRQRWDAQAMDALLMLVPQQAAIGCEGTGDFHADASGRLSRLAASGADASAPAFVFAGVYIAASSLLAHAPAAPFSANVLWDRACARGRLFGLALEGVWMHVGTPAALVAAEEILTRPRAPTPAPASASAPAQSNPQNHTGKAH